MKTWLAQSIAATGHAQVTLATATNLACREIREIPDGLDLHTDDHCFVMAGEWVVLGQINYYSNY